MNITKHQNRHINRLKAKLAKERATTNALFHAFYSRGHIIEKQILEIEQLNIQLDGLRRKNEGLAAQAEQAELLEQQLEGADLHIDELEIALLAAQLPAKSRENVIALLRRAA